MLVLQEKKFYFHFLGLLPVFKCPERIQAQSGSHIKYKAGSLSSVASLGSRVEAFRLRGCVG